MCSPGNGRVSAHLGWVGGIEGAVEVSQTDSRVVLEKKRTLEKRRGWRVREGITLVLNHEQEEAEQTIRQPRPIFAIR